MLLCTPHQVAYACEVAVVWYDINCKFRRWFMCWAAAQDALRAVLDRVSVLFPLPCFHRYSHRFVGQPNCGIIGLMHFAGAAALTSCRSAPPLHGCPARPPTACSASCQERNANVHMPGTALQYHEPNETLWANLSPLGTTTQVRRLGLLQPAPPKRSPPLLHLMPCVQYMNHRHRWARLERAAQLHNERQADRIVPRLQAMQAAAVRTRDQAASGAADALKQLCDLHGISEEQASVRQ